MTFEERLDTLTNLDRHSDMSADVPDLNDDRINTIADTLPPPPDQTHEADDLTLRLGRAEGKILFDFGQKLRAITLTPNQAEQLAGGLLNYARGHDDS